MAKKYICLYHSYLDAIQPLSEEERGRLLTALLRYAVQGEEPALMGNERFLFPMIRSQIDRDGEKYQRQCQQNSINGKRGGRPKKPKKPAGFSDCEKSQGKEEEERKEERKEKQEEEREGKGKEKEKKAPPSGGRAPSRRFFPPTLEEVQSYIEQRRSPVDAQQFIDFYTAKGWMIGKTPMMDWQAACRNAEGWEQWQRAGKSWGSHEEEKEEERGDTL